MACSLHSTLRIWEQPASVTLLLKAGGRAGVRAERGPWLRNTPHHPTGCGPGAPPGLAPQTQPRRKGGPGRAQALGLSV